MILAMMFFVFGMARAVNADVVDDPIKWSQLPDMEWGFDILSFGDADHNFEFGPPLTPIIADDWCCDDGNAAITDVHWWGSYENWSDDSSPGNVDSFVIGIFYDEAGDVCRPGEPIGFGCFDIAEVNETYYGQQELTEHSAFQYYVDLDEPFYQEEGETYWLMIAAAYTEEEPDNIWGWKTAYPDSSPLSSGAYGLYEDAWWDLVYCDFHEQLITYPNFDINYPYDPETPVQMAFELTTAIPEPTTMLLLGSLATGLFGVAAVRRKK